LGIEQGIGADLYSQRFGYEVKRGKEELQPKTGFYVQLLITFKALH